MLMVGLALMGKVEVVLMLTVVLVGFDGGGGAGFDGEGGVVLDVEGGVGYDGGGGAGVQLSSRKSRRCPTICAHAPPRQSACASVRYP